MENNNKNELEKAANERDNEVLSDEQLDEVVGGIVSTAAASIVVAQPALELQLGRFDIRQIDASVLVAHRS